MSLGSTAAAAAGTTASGQSTGALGSLASNYNNFLSLLMTQLRNQDPSSPMDPNAFTSQLVQFASVEQQINANANLTHLIGLSQASEVIQSSAILGKQITVASPKLSLQNGAGAIRFTAPAAENVTIAVTNASGVNLRQVTLKAGAGMNNWSWDGKNGNGATMPDGAYTVSVTGGPAGLPSQALPFSVIATATGVGNSGNSVQLQLGSLSVPFSAVQSVGN